MGRARWQGCLGYEVSEGMATAWVTGGQVVLRKPANPGYGVRTLWWVAVGCLAGEGRGHRESGETRDPGRDRDMETLWCGEFERLQSLVAKSGGNLSIESARPVGQYPQKVVADLGHSQVHDDVATIRHLTRK